MKRISITIIFSVLSINALCGAMPAELQAETRFVTIGSGDITGVYYPTGLIIAKMINDKRQEYGVRATVESTPGSVFNVNAIMAGYLEFGLVQSDKQYQAVEGLAEWAKKGLQEELRAVLSIHQESVCLVAAVEAGIETMADLKGKRVNLGHAGAAEYFNAIDALESTGLNPDSDILAEKVKAAEAPLLLQDNRIDAFFCTVGHPNEILKEAVSGSRKVRFIPITGPGIDKLIADRKYYSKTTIPVAKFYRDAEDAINVETFGVTATLCTSAQVPDYVVYVITKELFDNFDYFKRQHPAYANLTKKSMLEGLSAPLHPGALKYYKEAGLMP
ncbi:MAG: TAXI family TRAP transporter solute-binding subunit [Desulfobacterales bacterium]